MSNDEFYKVPGAGDLDSLKNIEWGSEEFEKVIKKAQEEKEIKNEYKKIHEAIRIIKGG